MTDIDERLARIEAKLDALLEALDSDEPEDGPTVVQTMDGQRVELEPDEGLTL